MVESARWTTRLAPVASTTVPLGTTSAAAARCAPPSKVSSGISCAVASPGDAFDPEGASNFGEHQLDERLVQDGLIDELI